MTGDQDAAGPRVLVADDSAELRSIVHAVLEGGGAEVVAEAGDGDEALALAQAQAVDVVVLDAAMPGPPAAEVVAALARLAPAPAVVIYSGWPAGELTGLGVPVVEKGSDPARLAAAVLAAAARRADG